MGEKKKRWHKGTLIIYFDQTITFSVIFCITIISVCCLPIRCVDSAKIGSISNNTTFLNHHNNHQQVAAAAAATAAVAASSTSLNGPAKAVVPHSSNRNWPKGYPLAPANHCSDRQFRCESGVCVHISFVCDGDADCDDKSDENADLCQPTEPTCSADKFRCKNGLCIFARWQCDRENDCSDGSDEDPDICKSRQCSVEEFTCKSGDGECIPLAWMCDQNNDCTDGSDEAQCNDTCRVDEFTCGNGHCIQRGWMCDHDHDCEDGSDERDCPMTNCDPVKEFSCASGNQCISAKWRCDSDVDCVDHSDEANCTTKRRSAAVCLVQEYACNDRLTCINRSWLCDGQNDCPGGEDEMLPQCRNFTCREDQFQCKDKKCIPGNLMCSGTKECEDGSDEWNCTAAQSAPIVKCDPKTQFDCGGMCILQTKVCDKKVDCPDGSDEPANKCGIDECAKNNGGCSQICVNQPIGYYCDCRKGYKLSDNRTCEDIDECTEIDGACSQICYNEKGGFKCECQTGYQRDPRNHTRCKATEGHASLLFARRRDIRKISLDHFEMTSIVNDTRSATALDYVFRTGMIFWSDVNEQKIFKAPIDEGNDKSVVVKDNMITSDGLAVDWIYNHIYFTDTHKCTIELTNFDGNMGKVLVKDDIEIPRAIALDPIDGWMFYTDWGASPRIERVGMDGSHRQTIVSSNVKWPNGITLDLVRKRVYWVDAKLLVISACDYDGNKRKVILYSTDHLRHPFSITTFEDWVYWTDWDKAAVFKANKFNGENVQAVTVKGMLEHPMTIHVYHPYRQPDGVNHCQAVNGHCSHLCLPAPRINARSPRISCACPTGLALTEDGLMCSEDVSATSTNAYFTSTTTITTIDPTIIDRDPIITHDANNHTVVVVQPMMTPPPPPPPPGRGGAYVDSTTTHPHHASITSQPSATAQHHPFVTRPTTVVRDGGDPSSSSVKNHTAYAAPIDQMNATTPRVHPANSGNTSFDNNGGTLLLHPDEADSGKVALVVIAAVSTIFIILAVVMYCLYQHYRQHNLTSMNFDNPVYRKTTEDQFSLEKPATNGSGAAAAAATRMYASTVDEETQEPLNKPGTNDFV